MKKDWFIVNPVVIIPECIKNGKKQDCFNCNLQKQNLCNSPRSWCVKKYEGHEKGCPNYGKRKLCPPNVPIFTDIFDINKKIYAIIYKYDIKEKNIQNLDYNYIENEHRKIIDRFLEENNKENYEIVAPEAMGVDVGKTLEKVDIEIKWPPKDSIIMVAMAAIPLKNKSIKEYCDDNNNTLTCYFKK